MNKRLEEAAEEYAYQENEFIRLTDKQAFRAGAHWYSKHQWLGINDKSIEGKFMFEYSDKDLLLMFPRMVIIRGDEPYPGDGKVMAWMPILNVNV